jgi:uncharacterized protein YcbK (DUF882 family)
MPISAVATVAMAPSERASVSRADEPVNASAFAGLFAAAVNGPRPEPKAEQALEGTSELDQADAAIDDAEPGSVGENGPPAAASATNEIVRSLSALDPQLQAKLQRVAARVRNETGHTVTVSETYRSQARQNALFAQGRQTPGAVVTWTQNSKHTQGRAVDVTLDGGAAGPDAYRALQRIANEEGLQTLGARDPGHLELRGSGAGTRVGGAPNIPFEPADASGRGQAPITQLAPVARVADVDRPARVARVAQVAEVTKPGNVLLGAMNGRSASSSGRGSRDSNGDARSNAYAEMGPTLSVRLPQEAARIDAPTAAAPSDALARAERIMSVMDSAPVRPLSHITMNVDGGNGTTDRVHVSLRGSALDTTIDTGDSRVASMLRARGDELSRALSRDGIELRELRVRAATETGTVTAAANAQSAQTAADSSTQSRFDRTEAWQRQQDQQERQRSQQDRDRHQQRQRRGGEQ